MFLRNKLYTALCTMVLCTIFLILNYNQSKAMSIMNKKPKNLSEIEEQIKLLIPQAERGGRRALEKIHNLALQDPKISELNSLNREDFSAFKLLFNNTNISDYSAIAWTLYNLYQEPNPLYAYLLAQKLLNIKDIDSALNWYMTASMMAKIDLLELKDNGKLISQKDIELEFPVIGFKEKLKNKKELEQALIFALYQESLFLKAETLSSRLKYKNEATWKKDRIAIKQEFIEYFNSNFNQNKDRSEKPNLTFKDHNFGVDCYNASDLEVIYANMKDFEKGKCRGRLPHDKSRIKANTLGLVAFSGPVDVKWKSKDGKQHQYQLDLNEIFKEKQVLHHEKIEDISIKSYSYTPGIYVEVDDRTLNVYMDLRIGLVFPILDKHGNPDSARRNVVLAFSKTFN